MKKHLASVRAGAFASCRGTVDHHHALFFGHRFFGHPETRIKVRTNPRYYNSVHWGVQQGNLRDDLLSGHHTQSPSYRYFYRMHCLPPDSKSRLSQFDVPVPPLPPSTPWIITLPIQESLLLTSVMPPQLSDSGLDPEEWNELTIQWNTIVAGPPPPTAGETAAKVATLVFTLGMAPLCCPQEKPKPKQDLLGEFVSHTMGPRLAEFGVHLANPIESDFLWLEMHIPANAGPLPSRDEMHLEILTLAQRGRPDEPNRTELEALAWLDAQSASFFQKNEADLSIDELYELWVTEVELGEIFVEVDPPPTYEEAIALPTLATMCARVLVEADYQWELQGNEQVKDSLASNSAASRLQLPKGSTSNVLSLKMLCNEALLEHNVVDPVLGVIDPDVQQSAHVLCLERVRRGQFSVKIGLESTGNGAGQFRWPLAALVTGNTINIADWQNKRVHIYQRDSDGPALSICDLRSEPRSISHNGRRTVVCCEGRKTYDLKLGESVWSAVEHKLDGEWPGRCLFGSLLGDGSFIALVGEGHSFRLEQFAQRASDDGWEHQPELSIALPMFTSASSSFTCDPTTFRVWWSWTIGEFYPKHYLGSWDIRTGRQLYQRQVAVKLERFSEHLSKGNLLVLGGPKFDVIYRISSHGTVLDKYEPGVGEMLSVSIGSDGSIATTISCQAIVYQIDAVRVEDLQGHSSESSESESSDSSD